MSDTSDMRADRDRGEDTQSEAEEKPQEGGAGVSDNDQASPKDEKDARIDSLLRALAEADNARKRAERLAAEAGHYAIGALARDLLLVADNLERALAAAKAETADNAALLEGVTVTAKLLESVLEQHGVRRVATRGVVFDPHEHEAVAVIKDEAREPGAIIDVIEDGYRIGDRLLRPARVVVNTLNS